METRDAKRLMLTALIYVALLFILLCVGYFFGSKLLDGHPHRTFRPNVLLVVLDDVGIDRIGAYEAHPDPGRTPNIDGLASKGLRCAFAWANPVCSPTRATLLTGRYSFRTGVGQVTQNAEARPGLQLSEYTLPEAMAVAGYRTFATGKWHLSSGVLDTYDHPNLSGFDSYAGALWNLPDYVFYNKWVNGQNLRPLADRPLRYATSETVDDAIAAIEAGGGPWFGYVAFNAAHAPHHVPPVDLHAFGQVSGVPLRFKAMVEAMDTEIGRLLSVVDLNETVVIVVGDNGTQGAATTAPFLPEHAKATPYLGGVQVPLILAGPGIPEGVHETPVNTTDVYATVLQLAGATSGAEDSISIFAKKPRRFVYAERFQPNGIGVVRTSYRRTVSDGRFKLIVFHDQPDEFYDLASDPFEEDDLMVGGMTSEQSAGLSTLQAQLAMPEMGGP